MAKLDFRGLVPGKRYKIVIHPETVYGTMKALPTIDFIVPEAPPRARGFRLDIRTRYKPVIVGYRNRKLRIYKYKITYNANTGKRHVVIITGTGTFRKNKIKAGDKIKVAAPSAISTGTTAVTVLNRENTPKNRIRYLHPIQNTSTTSWTTYTTDDSPSISNADKPITHVNGGSAIIEKIPYVRIRIPKPIFQNLMWNDTVRDFVHIVYRKGNSKKTITGSRKYLLTDTDVSRDTPIQDGISGFDIDNTTYPNGHPPVFVKEIRDKKFYQFEFIVARYTRTQNTDGSYTAWSGSWIEQNTPFNKKLSKPAGWKA
jgi:hypothetical protein